MSQAPDRRPRLGGLVVPSPTPGLYFCHSSVSHLLMPSFPHCPDAILVIYTLFAHIVRVQLVHYSQEPSWQSKNTPRLYGSAVYPLQPWLRDARRK